jgi:hypothetical protein
MNVFSNARVVLADGVLPRGSVCVRDGAADSRRGWPVRTISMATGCRPPGGRHVTPRPA